MIGGWLGGSSFLKESEKMEWSSNELRSYVILAVVVTMIFSFLAMAILTRSCDIYKERMKKIVIEGIQEGCACCVDGGLPPCITAADPCSCGAE